jgi:hypothetical protein
MHLYNKSRKGAVCASVILFLLFLAFANLAWADDATGVDALEASSWWTEAQKNLSEQAYEVTWEKEAGALQASNRAAGLRALFCAGRVELLPRKGADWKWDFVLTSYGREGALESVNGVEPVAEGRRVEYRHGGITQWYVNRNEGIEQGFTIHERPLGDGHLVVKGRVSGDLEAHLNAEGQRVSFRREGEEVLSYGKLVVMDAEGRELPSRIELEGDGLSIVIEGEGQYPIYVDPLLTTPDWTAESDQAAAQFGVGVSNAGDVNGDGYGDVIVGANYYDNGETNEGRAFVYHGSASGLSTTPDWTAESDQAGAHLGFAVSPSRALGT